MNRWPADRAAVTLLAGEVLGAAEFVPDDAFRVSVLRFSELAQSYLELVTIMGGDLPGRGVSPLPRSALFHQADPRDATRLAQGVRDALGWGGGPIADHLLALAAPHAMVFRLPLGEPHSGFFFNHRSIGFCAVVNSQLNLGRHLFALAAQLCHAFCHSHLRDVWFSVPRGPEQRLADRFAAQLLVPDSALAKAVGALGGGVRPSHPVAALHLQRTFGVSYALVAVRLRQSGLISEDEYHRMGQASPTRLAPGLGYSPNALDRGRGANPPSLATAPRPMLQLVCAALSKGVLTKTQAARVLALSPQSVAELMEFPAVEEPEEAVWAEMDQLGGW
ncbi:MAG: ImmA/IrrE family metallo-endopeptidase [bacterium]|nr:ImmA/IrrE family metallo-endopeptidase [Acidimicrobiia bacterium]MCY4651277.1 ImmA/IrrE family metallo-endopeptidase [bacterium]